MDFMDLINIDKTWNTPLYFQIKEEIKRLIRDEILAPGAKLATERELSKRLNVSRNTVSMAYKELETEGYVSSEQGKGTFVFHHDNKEEVFSDLIDHLFHQALALDYNIEYLKEQFMERYDEKRSEVKLLTVAFIECNQEQLTYLSHQLEHRFNIHVMPILFSELWDRKGKVLDILEQTDLVVTTLFHINDVRYILNEMNIEKHTVAMALEFKMTTMVEIAKISKDQHVSILCRSEDFAKNVKYLIQKINPDLADIDISISMDREEVNRFVKEADVLLYSPGRGKDIRTIVSKAQLIEIILLPDTGSMCYLETSISELKS